jgi:hypothetical protein
LSSSRALPALTLACAAGLLVMACHEPHQSPVSQRGAAEHPEGSGLDLVYLCGNKFLVTNAMPSSVEVQYRVAGSSETGSLRLEAGPGGDPGYSETELETSEKGVVELYYEDVRVVRRANDDLPCGASPVSAMVMAAGSEATAGVWTAPFTWPGVAVHLSLLPDGNVLSWGLAGQPYVWNPSTKAFHEVPVGTELFCSGHSFLPDGRLLVAGGHHQDAQGLPDINLFQRSTSTWSSGPKMAKGRWYPTVTTLANGEAVILSGTDLTERMVRVPEVWSSSGLRALTGASRNLMYYPRSFLAPNGRIFYAGDNQETAYLSTAGAGSWTFVANRLRPTRNYGAAVMYEPGKVLYAGGGRTTNTAEIIDLNQAAPAWHYTGTMSYARRNVNATILPTGEVLVTGGTGGTTDNDESRAVFAAELWNPSTGTWSLMSSGSVVRGYHSTAILLPDGRVLVSGNGDSDAATDQRTAELYSPPYLFKGARPVISAVTSSWGYGQSIFVSSAQASSIKSVTLLRLGSTTHTVNMNQRFNRLSFTPGTGGLNVKSPVSRNLAPPGHYLLFILNGNGVPSTGKIVQLR